MDPTEAPAPEPTQKRKPGPGRPSKCTPEVTAKVCAAIERGHFIAIAARLAGIGPTTFHRWMEEGAKKGSKYRKFYLAVKRAEAVNEDRLVKRLDKLTKKDARAIFEMLARRHPERWAPPKERVELDANVNHAGGVRVWLPPEEES